MNLFRFDFLSKFLHFYHAASTRYWHSGSNAQCPCCGGNFRKFLPFGIKRPVFQEQKIVGGGYRLNAMCPGCFSLERERHIYLYLKNKKGFFQKKITLLHFAPEPALRKFFTSLPHIQYMCADIDASRAAVVTDITNIGFKEGCFDVVICCHVLEHVPDDRKAMSELYRVLKPGGWAILQVPVSLLLPKTYEDSGIVSLHEREQAYGQSDHVRIYSLENYKERLRSAGFVVTTYNFASEFGTSMCRRYGLLEQEELFICSK